MVLSTAGSIQRMRQRVYERHQLLLCERVHPSGIPYVSRGVLGPFRYGGGKNRSADRSVETHAFLSGSCRYGTWFAKRVVNRTVSIVLVPREGVMIAAASNGAVSKRWKHRIGAAPMQLQERETLCGQTHRQNCSISSSIFPNIAFINPNVEIIMQSLIQRTEIIKKCSLAV